MSAITELVDVVGIAKKITKDNDNMKAVAETAKLFRNAKAISASANKYVVNYPVIVSTRVSNYKTALAIAKQVELECARFIILASGLDPVVSSNDTVGNKLNNLFMTSEESLKFTITEASDEEFYSAENYLQSYYNLKKQDSFKKVSSFVQSKEMVDTDASNENSENEKEVVDQLNKENNTELNEDEEEFARQQMGIDINSDDFNKKPKDEQNKLKQDIKDNKKTNITWEGDNAYQKNLSKLSKVGPTIIKIKLLLDTNTTQFVEVPIAVKATLQYADSSDCVSLLRGTQTFSNKFQNLIKIISGETCFTEWLFQIEKAKNDVKREKELGKVPFYRNLINNKNRYKLKNLFGSIPLLKDFVAKKSKKDMPICTIVVHHDELSEALGYRLSKIVDEPSIIQKIMDTYMLLGVGIVDDVNDIIYFLFSGEDSYRIVEIDKLGQGGNGGEDSSALLMKMLNSTIGALTRH